MRRPPTARAFALVLLAAVARADGPADGLLKLAPADAGATLVVEDLRGFARSFADSPLADALANLPAVREWRESDARRAVEKVLGDLEAVTGVPASTLRDDLLGDAVVLALRVPPGAGPESARGLVLTRFRVRDLLDRLIDAANQGDRDSGALANLQTRPRGAASYTVRRFRDNVKPTEYFAILGDDIFAWSNSEELIQGAIDRHGRGAGADGLGAEPRFRKVRATLPAKAVASLFVDPRVLERLIAADSKGADHGPPEAARRSLAAVEYAGLALEWRAGFVAHVHATLDPKAIGEPLRHWAKGSGDASALIRHLPPTTLAFAVGRVDFAALHDLISHALGVGRNRTELVDSIAKGLLLGKDLRGDILPNLGPGVLIGLGEPTAEGPEAPWPLVLMVALGDRAEEAGVPAAVENALRTVGGLMALGQKDEDGPGPRTREREGVRVTTLPGGRFAFAVGRGLLVFGNAPEAVAAVVRDGQGGPGARFEQVRKSYFKDAESFAYADLDRLVRVADARRDVLAARRDAADDDARRDLDRSLDLLSLFRAAFATAALAPDASSLHLRVGLVGKKLLSAE
ncbi:MAG TPA: hypothetical protein VG406_26245 [Isosphaeraceae bacterium]|jgi:hypothetical protein|nr:hypothetical protein [Isosphaeraceae bacterium]